MSRKGVKRQRRQSKPEAAKAGDTISLLPMEIQIDDRFTDEGFEWQVMTPRWTPKTGQSWTAENRPVR